MLINGFIIDCLCCVGIICDLISVVSEQIFQKMEILGSIKTYEWGSVGNQSKVAQLALKHDENFVKEFNESTPYAELWYVFAIFFLS